MNSKWGDKSPTFHSFNPSEDARVTDIKTKVDDLIRYVEGLDVPEAGKRRIALAVTDFEEGSMWAVKALFS